LDLFKRGHFVLHKGICSHYAIICGMREALAIAGHYIPLLKACLNLKTSLDKTG